MTILKSPVTFTANRLLDGEAVWLGSNGRWVKSVDLARVIRTSAELEAATDEATLADQNNLVVEPYQIDIELQGSTVVPTKYRERIRAAGPTFRLDLGKQALVEAHAA